MSVTHVDYPPGYGLHLFGAIIPFPPAPVLWALAVLDIAATVWVWRRPSMWPVVAVGIVVSAYLAVVGMFSIGLIYVALFLVQIVLLGSDLGRRRRLPR